jgi:GTPase
MVGANTGGLIGMSKEHLAITLALSVPVAVVISKIDMTPANVLQETIKQLVKVLKSPGSRLAPRHCQECRYLSRPRRKTPVFVNSLEIATQVSQEFVLKR